METGAFFITYLEEIEILDSRGNPTVEVVLGISRSESAEPVAYGVGRAPSGASTGTYEAIELRDKDAKRYGGKGVKNALQNLEKVWDALEERQPFTSLEAFDQFLIELDGTPNKSHLGANLTLALSMAFARALSNGYQLPLYAFLGGSYANTLPVPFMNILNGGAHADNDVDIQEFMIVPLRFPSFQEALRAGVETYHALKQLLKANHYVVNVGDEGGFAPALRSNREALDFLMQAIEKAGYKPGEEIALALDIAANELYDSEKRIYQLEKQPFSGEKLMTFWGELCQSYPIVSIEDPFAEEDWESWIEFTRAYGKRLQIVGDDLFVTNIKRIQKGVELGAGNAVLIKPNQIGTVTETIRAIQFAHDHGYRTMISHRSGETEDTFISHLAVAFRSGQIKTGAPARGERTAKYNELLRIEHSLHSPSYFRFNTFS